MRWIWAISLRLARVLSNDLQGKRQPAGLVVNKLVSANISPEVPSPRRARSLLLLLIGLALGIVADRFLIAPKAGQDILQSSAQSVPRAQAPFSRIGNRIIVPPDSLLRSQLVVADVASKEVARSLVLPAMVEADPARTVKVLPPVTGRVVELKVQLGERVKEGQELAVIDSGDLAQVYSDIEKAQSALTLTKKALDRQMGLQKIGGGAIKEREQAENDYAQAKRSSTAPKRDCAPSAYRPSRWQEPPADHEGAGRRQRDRSADRPRCVPQRYHRGDDDDCEPGHDLGHGQRAGEGHFVRLHRADRQRHVPRLTRTRSSAARSCLSAT